VKHYERIESILEKRPEELDTIEVRYLQERMQYIYSITSNSCMSDMSEGVESFLSIYDLFDLHDRPNDYPRYPTEDDDEFYE